MKRLTRQRGPSIEVVLDIVRQAVERYLEDFDDLNVAVARLQDPTDEVLDWDQVKRELLVRGP